jgi:hypothetical protein
MPTLASLGLLLIFLAVSATPPSATTVAIRMSPAAPITLARESGGWWARDDDTGGRVSFRRDGTNLVGSAAPGQRETRVDMAAYFDLTAGADLTKDAINRGKSAEVTGAVTTRVEKTRRVVTVTAAGTTESAIIMWATRR